LTAAKIVFAQTIHAQTILARGYLGTVEAVRTPYDWTAAHRETLAAA
jgi:hypothetical protein